MKPSLCLSILQKHTLKFRKKELGNFEYEYHLNLLTYTTLNSFIKGSFPLIQCAAVTTQNGSIILPPQWASSMNLISTCHGQTPFLASTPLIIRPPWALTTPHAPIIRKYSRNILAVDTVWIQLSVCYKVFTQFSPSVFNEIDWLHQILSIWKPFSDIKNYRRATSLIKNWVGSNSNRWLIYKHCYSWEPDKNGSTT